MFGYAGTLLRINLSTGEIVKESLSETMCNEFIGGRGFVAKTLYEELPPGTHPFDANNLFIIATGPLSGHFLPASGKTHDPGTGAVDRRPAHPRLWRGGRQAEALCSRVC